MAKFTVAMIDYDYKSLDLFRDELARWGCDFKAQHSKDINDAIAFANGADGVIIQALGPVDGKFMDSVRTAKVLGRTGIGIDPIDVKAATERKIVVCNVPNYCELEVADHAMALALSLLRKVTLYDRTVKGGKWDFNVGKPIHRLQGQKFGLLGFGKIPRQVAPRAKAFGFEVLAHDPFVTPAQFAAAGVKGVSFDEIFQQSDIISVHVPLIPSTRGLIGEKQFKMMKPGAFIVNTARGPIVDHVSLVAALKGGLIAGAALDVTPTEPPKADDPLIQFENVILTPHAGYYSEESTKDLHILCARYVGMAVNGKRPDGLYNPDVLKVVTLK